MEIPGELAKQIEPSAPFSFMNNIEFMSEFYIADNNYFENDHYVLDICYDRSCHHNGVLNFRNGLYCCSKKMLVGILQKLKKYIASRIQERQTETFDDFQLMTNLPSHIKRIIQRYLYSFRFYYMIIDETNNYTHIKIFTNLCDYEIVKDIDLHIFN